MSTAARWAAAANRKSTTASPAKPSVPTLLSSSETAFHSLHVEIDFRANVVSGENSASFVCQQAGLWGTWSCDYERTEAGITLTLHPGVDLAGKAVD